MSIADFVVVDVPPAPPSRSFRRLNTGLSGAIVALKPGQALRFPATVKSSALSSRVSYLKRENRLNGHDYTTAVVDGYRWLWCVESDKNRGRA